MTRHFLYGLMGWAVCFAGLSGAGAQDADVMFDVSTLRSLGGHGTELQREKFFTIHADYYAEDLTVDDLDFLVNDLDVGFGRVFNSPFYYFAGKDLPYPTEAQLQALKTFHQDRTRTHPLWRFRTTRRVITDHPSVVFSMEEDPAKAAAYAADFFTHMYADGEVPEFYEPMNEPFVHTRDFGKDDQQVRERMALLFKEIGKAFDERDLPTKVIGYASAWPSMELWDFKHWRTRMKMFMDVAGDYMDAFSTHLYDGTNVKGQDNRRSGSNSEAILDLIETYSFIKWGEVKPHAITEYGDIPKGFGKGYSDLRSSQELNAMNHLLFTFLDREDRMDISVPFITAKSPWHFVEVGAYAPYLADLWRPNPDHIENGDVVEYIPTIKMKFFKLWAGVQGNRIVTGSDDPDLRVHGFLDDRDLFLCLNNLDESVRTVALDTVTELGPPERTRLRRLYVSATEAARLTETELPAIPDTLALAPHETVVLHVTLKARPGQSGTKGTYTHYSKTYLQPIQANQPLSFAFEGVRADGEGNARLRMSLGRKHDRSKQPKLRVNGEAVPVPDNWPGYDQANRSDFFGAIEIPVPAGLLAEQTTVELTFPDDGGHVSSVVLVAEAEA